MRLASRTDSKVDRLLQWQAGATPGPWEVMVFPTNRCNQRCKICWQRWAEEEFGKVDFATEIPDNRLLNLVDEGADVGVREWTIVGGGDPLVRADLVMEMCQRIMVRGMAGELHSNGTLYTKDHLAHLIRIAWPRLGVSLDGPDAETNDAIRTRGSFDRATRNLKMLAEMKKAAGAKLPHVAIHAVVTSRNFNKLAQMVEFVKDVGAGEIGLSELLVHGDVNTDFQLSAAQREQLPAHLEKAARLAETYKFKNNIRSLLLQHEHQKNPDRDGQLVSAQCYEAWLTLSIIAEGGRAGPCCVFWEQEGDCESIRDKSLREVWLGPYMQNVREKLLSGTDLPRYCAQCPSHVMDRTEYLRALLRGRQDAVWSAMNAGERAAFLANRLKVNLRRRGIRQTVKRAREWVYLHYR